VSIAGLQKVVKQYPLAIGLGQKDDIRAPGTPALDICKDVEFDDTGGIQTRKPYAAMGLTIANGGGTIPAADVRRIFDNGGELVLFTKTRLYSWVPVLNAWSDRGEHLAAALDEEIVFATNGDQQICDRCELAGMQFYTWQDGTSVYLGVRDTATKAVVFGPYLIGALSRPRLVPVNGRVLLFALTRHVSIMTALSVTMRSMGDGQRGALVGVVRVERQRLGEILLRFLRIAVLANRLRRRVSTCPDRGRRFQCSPSTQQAPWRIARNAGRSRSASAVQAQGSAPAWVARVR